VVTATNLGLRSSDPEPTQRRRTACGQDLVVVVGVKGCWNYKVIRSQRSSLEGLIDDRDDADDEY